MVECTNCTCLLGPTHCHSVTLQFHNFDLFTTCRTSSLCTVAWQLARFQLTRRIARSSAIAGLLVNSRVIKKYTATHTFKANKHIALLFVLYLRDVSKIYYNTVLYNKIRSTILMTTRSIKALCTSVKHDECTKQSRLLEKNRRKIFMQVSRSVHIDATELN